MPVYPSTVRTSIQKSIGIGAVTGRAPTTSDAKPTAPISSLM